nr:MAG TPA: hypothetical protein [Bacteriophage sp.]
MDSFITHPVTQGYHYGDTLRILEGMLELGGYLRVSLGLSLGDY